LVILLTCLSDNGIEKIAYSLLNIKLGNLTPDELDKLLKNTKNKKAAGLDSIPPEHRILVPKFLQLGLQQRPNQKLERRLGT